MSEDKKNDPLIERYHDASAQEHAGPSPRVREAVLARAAAVANTRTHENALPKKEAANDGVWRWKIAASVAVIGFTGMVAKHYIDAPLPERIETPAPVSRSASANANATEPTKNKTDTPLVDLASEASAPSLKPPAAQIATSQPPKELVKEVPSQYASVAAPSAASATAVATESSALRKEVSPLAAKRGAPTSTPAPQEPTTSMIDNRVAVVRDHVASKESVRRRQPEMSTGDAPLAAPAAAAPMAPTAVAVVPASPPIEANLVAPAPLPSAPAPNTAGAVMRAPAAPAKNVSGLAIADEPTLIAAIRNGDSEALRRELASGTSPNARALDGMSALTLAAQRGRSDDVAALLRAGANVNSRDARGRTALSAALMQGHTEIVAMLRAAGAVE
jgi:Ankyrin repeats (3 copies)